VRCGGGGEVARGTHDDVCCANVVTDERALAKERARVQRVDHVAVLANGYLALTDDEELVALLPLHTRLPQFGNLQLELTDEAHIYPRRYCSARKGPTKEAYTKGGTTAQSHDADSAISLSLRWYGRVRETANRRAR
jgi:hypothetical protein